MSAVAASRPAGLMVPAAALCSRDFALPSHGAHFNTECQHCRLILCYDARFRTAHGYDFLMPLGPLYGYCPPTSNDFGWLIALRPSACYGGDPAPSFPAPVHVARHKLQEELLRASTTIARSRSPQALPAIEKVIGHVCSVPGSTEGLGPGKGTLERSHRPVGG
jgi:hypothetical protein